MGIFGAWFLASKIAEAKKPWVMNSPQYDGPQLPTYPAPGAALGTTQIAPSAILTGGTYTLVFVPKDPALQYRTTYQPLLPTHPGITPFEANQREMAIREMLTASGYVILNLGGSLSEMDAWLTTVQRVAPATHDMNGGLPASVTLLTAYA